MIDNEKTFREMGYCSTDLSYGSGKKVWSVCDECRQGRWISYQSYHALCHRCAMKSEEIRKKISKKHVDMSGKNNPMYGKRHPDTVRQKCRYAYHPSGEDHPMYGKHHSKKTKRKISDNHADQNGEKNQFFGRKHTLESINKIRKNHADMSGKNNPMYGRRGSNAPSWVGGISFEPYCPKFNESFKESIREEFGRVCFLCPTSEEENGRKLSVHHVQYEKNCLCDDIKCEFVPLCDSCHGKTNHNREHWEALILEKLAVIT